MEIPEQEGKQFSETTRAFGHSHAAEEALVQLHHGPETTQCGRLTSAHTPYRHFPPDCGKDAP